MATLGITGLGTMADFTCAITKRLANSNMTKYIAVLTLAAGLAGGMAALAADKKETTPYPLDKCVVSDEKLGSMGKPYVFTNGVQEVKLCCKGCLKDFQKDAVKYTKKIEASQKK